MTPQSLFQLASSFPAADILLIAAFFYVLPVLTRRDIFFAVTVDPAYRKTDEARRSLQEFRIAVWIHSLVGLIVVFAGIATRSILLPLVGVFWLTAGAFWAFRNARKETMPHAALPSPRREAAIASRPTAGIHVYRLLQIGPFAILTAVALYLRANWYRIPDRFPIHWGMSGQPNGWATRSFLGVFGPLLIAFTVCTGMALFAYATVHWSRQIRASGQGAENEHRFRQTQLGIMLAVEYFIALVFAGVGFMPLRAQPRELPAAASYTLLGSLAFVLVILAIAAYTGQGGENLMKAGQSSDIAIPDGFPIGDRTPDTCWKGGVFYVNRNDPAIMVESRFGVGYTMNFAHPASWLILSVIAGVPLIVALVVAFRH